MAIIQSGATADQLTIDPTSKAGRSTLYDATGAEIHPNPTGSYIIPIFVKQSAATVAATPIWAMRNGATKTIRIRRIRGIVSFSGTAAGVHVFWDFRRFTTAAYTGGTAIIVQKKRTSDPATTVADARFLDTGLTVGTVVIDAAPTIQVALPISVTGIQQALNIDFTSPAERYSPFTLAANEGLVITTGFAATVIGAAIAGYAEFDEV